MASYQNQHHIQDVMVENRICDASSKNLSMYGVSAKMFCRTYIFLIRYKRLAHKSNLSPA